ncbi:MAG: alpha/beta fold hydrolase [Chloroflexi bacterium]|nr:alpha/beta fold hydrolase [Chloroflexota bacterium]
MPTAPINGIDLFYEDTDPENAQGLPALVWLHGAAGNHMSWWQQIPHFRQDYRCIAIDQRGFGRSHDATGEGTLRFIDDLEALVDHLGVERVSLVAQSMGGRAALGFAVRHPDRVAALVMADTWGFFDWPEQQERARSMQPAVTTPLVHRALADSYQEQHPALTFLYRQIQALNPPRDATQVMAEGAPTLQQVQACTVPTLCLVGDEDRVAPPPLISALAEQLPNARYVEVPGAGHSVYFEKPEEFNDLVGAFLAEHRA